MTCVLVYIEIIISHDSIMFDMKKGESVHLNAIHWVPLFGPVQVDDGSIKFVLDATEASVRSEPETAEIASNFDFTQGDIQFNVAFSEKTSMCSVVLNTMQDTGQLHIGLNLGGAFGIATYNGSWDIIKTVGEISQLQPNRTYHVRVSIVGQQVRLFVDTVLVLECDVRIDRSPVHLYMFGRERIIFSDIEFTRRKVFVALSDVAREQIGMKIDGVIRQELLEPVSLDMTFHTVSDVVRTIAESSCVITTAASDYSLGFYQVGIAHGMGKPVIVLCHKAERGTYLFAYDHTQTVFYDDSLSGNSHLEASVRKLLSSL